MVLSSSSTAGGTAAIAAVNDDHVDVDDSTKDDDETATSNNANGIVAIRHRGGYSLSRTMTTTFMPILFIIQLYTFLQVGFWGMVGV